MESASVEIVGVADEAKEHARSVGRAIAVEISFSHTVDERALEMARRYATTAGDSLAKDVRSCLRYGNAAAAAFDAMIFEFAVVAVVTTFHWCSRPHMQLVEAHRGVRRVRTTPRHQQRWSSRLERRVWSGQLA